MQVLDHERLDVCRVARELSRELHRITRNVRPRHDRGDILSQVYRCTASIPLNIAEGSGETSTGRKAYFYRISRGSATELSAALDHMVDMGMLGEDATVAAKALIVRVVSMLFQLTRSVTSPDPFPPLPKRTQNRWRHSRKPKME